MNANLTDTPSNTFLDTGLQLFSDLTYKVAEMSPAMVRFGRKELELALDEMPGLRSLREELVASQPLAGARIMGSLHMTIQTGVLIETLLALGAKVQWVSCNIFSTQDHAAAAIAAGSEGSASDIQGPPVFAWKGESLPEYWWCTFQALIWEGEAANLILDDGGDATMLLHMGYEFEQSESKEIPAPSSADSEEGSVVLELLHQVRAERGDRFWTESMIPSMRGVSEETTTGVHRLYQRVEAGTLLFPAINVNDSVTKSKFDNLYGCRHSLVDAIMRATDIMLSGKKVLICGFGDVGKGSVQSLRSQQARVSISEIDPICALQGCMMGLTVLTVEDAIADDYQIFVTATGNKDIITATHMSQMRHGAIVCNIGHFDNEIDIAGLDALAAAGKVERIEVKPQVHEWRFNESEGIKAHSILVLAEGRLVNLGCATGHPSFVMSASFTNQVMAQIELHENAESFGKTVTVLSKILDEKVARLHLDAFGVKLTTLSAEQASYIDVAVEGPYKPTHYRY